MTRLVTILSLLFGCYATSAQSNQIPDMQETLERETAKGKVLALHNGAALLQQLFNVCYQVVSSTRIKDQVDILPAIDIEICGGDLAKALVQSTENKK